MFGGEQTCSIRDQQRVCSRHRASSARKCIGSSGGVAQTIIIARHTRHVRRALIANQRSSSSHDENDNFGEVRHHDAAGCAFVRLMFQCLLTESLVLFDFLIIRLRSINSMFEWSLSSERVCVDCSSNVKQDVPFFLLSLPIPKSPSTLNECFDQLLLRHDTAIECCRLPTKSAARIDYCVSKWPTILCVQLKRFQVVDVEKEITEKLDNEGERLFVQFSF